MATSPETTHTGLEGRSRKQPGSNSDIREARRMSNIFGGHDIEDEYVPLTGQELHERRASKHHKRSLKRIVAAGAAAGALVITGVGKGDPIQGVESINRGAGNIPGEVVKSASDANEKFNRNVGFETEQYRGNELTPAQKEIMSGEGDGGRAAAVAIDIAQEESAAQQVAVDVRHSGE